MAQDPQSRLTGKLLSRLRGGGSFETVFTLAGRLLKQHIGISPLIFIDIPSDPGSGCSVFDSATSQTLRGDRNLPVFLWGDSINSIKPFLFSLRTPPNTETFWRKFSLPLQPNGWAYPVLEGSSITGYVVFIFPQSTKIPSLRAIFSVADCIAIAYSQNRSKTPYRYDAIFNEGKITRITWEVQGDRHWLVQDISSNCLNIGYQYSEIIGTNFADIIHFDDLDRIKERFNPSDLQERSWEEKYRVVSPTGNILWLYSHAYVEEQRVPPFYISGLLIDVSGEVKALEQFKNSLANLEWFAYAASHDLKEPTNTIVGRLRMVERALVQSSHAVTALENLLIPEAIASPEFQELKRLLKSAETGSIAYPVLRALKGAKRLGELIDGLLQYSRVAQHEVKFNYFDSAEAIGGVIDGLSNVINKSGATIEVLTPLPRVYGDRAMFMVVVQNLIENSIKFCKPAQYPEVYVSCRSLELEENSVFTASNLKTFEWKFTIADNGIGFDSLQYQSKIFQPFARLHSSEQYQGTGVGLASCHKIVSLWDGKIEADSMPGQGASFSFTIPADRGQL